MVSDAICCTNTSFFSIRTPQGSSCGQMSSRCPWECQLLFSSAVLWGTKSCLGELKRRGHEPSGVALVTPGPLVIIPPETSVVRLNSKPFQGLHWEGPISKDCSPAWGGWGYWGGKPEGSYAALIPLPTTRVSSAQIVALPQHPRDLRQ